MIDFNERAIAPRAVAKVIHIVVTGPLAVVADPRFRSGHAPKPMAFFNKKLACIRIA
jgi:hypothetical protein